MLDNRTSPRVHNKSIMCNFISIQSILLSHCEANTFPFLSLSSFARCSKRLPLIFFKYYINISQNCTGKKGRFSLTSFCFFTACEGGMSVFCTRLFCNEGTERALNGSANVGGNPIRSVIPGCGSGDLHDKACWDERQSHEAR